MSEWMKCELQYLDDPRLGQASAAMIASVSFELGIRGIAHVEVVEGHFGERALGRASKE
jgi:hypothetical protein